MTEVYTMSHWNNTSATEKEYAILYEKYISPAGYHEIIPSANKKANSTLRQIMNLSNKIQRFYNDGDAFRYKGKTLYYWDSNNKASRGSGGGHGTTYVGENQQLIINSTLKILERQMDILVLKAYKLTDGGTK